MIQLIMDKHIIIGFVNMTTSRIWMTLQQITNFYSDFKQVVIYVGSCHCHGSNKIITFFIMTIIKNSQYQKSLSVSAQRQFLD